MNKVKMNTAKTEMEATAALLGLTLTGNKKEQVEQVNTAIDAKIAADAADAQTAGAGETAPEKPVVTLESLGFVPNQKVLILGRSVKGEKQILANRLMVLTKVGKKPGMVGGQLVHPKTGLLQKSEIAMPIDCITATLPEVTPAPEATKAEEAAVV